jgi:tRNA C32,U32 (ribose-2'-O)-methylase TrmJ
MASLQHHMSVTEHGIRILGIEIAADALPVQSHPFHGPTAFFPGNEGDGLHPREMAVCDGFVYIPHYGVGTASLNVNVASSIVFHHFAMWAGYHERERAGHKFVVAERRVKHGAETEADMDLRRQREAARNVAVDDGLDAAAAQALFG